MRLEDWKCSKEKRKVRKSAWRWTIEVTNGSWPVDFRVQKDKWRVEIVEYPHLKVSLLGATYP